jgi:hypothetical protein
MSFEVFVSYSHKDEWLKDELIEHLSSLERSGKVTAWHDRKIVAGSKLDPSIQTKISNSKIFLFLISPSFLSSNYCVEKEYLQAKLRAESGDAQIVPVIVRECDWDLHGLKEFVALPIDAQAVTKNAYSKDDSSQRDGKWLEVVDGLKGVIQALKKKMTPPELLPAYVEKLFKVDFVRHPSLSIFDEEKFWTDPEVYYEKQKKQINRSSELTNLVNEATAVVFTGSDRSGKTMIAKKLQTGLCQIGSQSVLISGSKISNVNVVEIVSKAIVRQFGSDRMPHKNVSIIVDDFDNCSLSDRLKEEVVRRLVAEFAKLIIFSFSSAPAVLFAPDDLPNPIALSILPFGDEKIYELVKRWKLEENGNPSGIADEKLVQVFERILLLFNQTEMEKYAFNVVTFLELLDSSIGGDIAPSSFASCYESLVQNRLIKNGCDHRQLDEIKNFLSLIAYRAFSDTEDAFLTKIAFDECLEVFVQQYLSSAIALKKATLDLFLFETSDGMQFKEDYIWYFLCARYVGKRLKSDNPTKYNAFIVSSTRKVFQKKHANIVIYLAYFTDDSLVLDELMKLLDQLFAKAEDWRLSDKSSSIILGLGSGDGLAISSSSEVDKHRAELMKDQVGDILEDAETVVARYTLPFLAPQMEDANFQDLAQGDDFNGDSYIRSVNALMRTHSVIGQILNSRSGTYSGSVVVNCIEKMVHASGRYASLNHAIATLMIYDPALAIESANAVLRTEGMTEGEKYKKVMRIFAFWSVFLSQTGLARYLAQDHSIRALQRLADEHENEASDDGHVPYNFTSVLLISRLYSTGAIDKEGIEAALKKYGADSSLFAVFRATIHIYSYYMPMTVQDKQWLSTKLGVPIKALEMQKLKSARNKGFTKASLLEFEPSSTNHKD